MAEFLVRLALVVVFLAGLWTLGVLITLDVGYLFAEGTYGIVSRLLFACAAFKPVLAYLSDELP